LCSLLPLTSSQFSEILLPTPNQMSSVLNFTTLNIHLIDRSRWRYFGSEWVSLELTLQIDIVVSKKILSQEKQTTTINATNKEDLESKYLKESIDWGEK
jgi:hypothetical protein